MPVEDRHQPRPAVDAHWAQFEARQGIPRPADSATGSAPARLGFAVSIGFPRSGEDLRDDLAVDVGEAVVATRVPIGETCVIDAHQVQDGGVQVVHVDG